MRAKALVALAGAAWMGACARPDSTDETEAKRALRPAPRPHLDHSTFFQKPFVDGPAVTRACLECHKDAATQVMATSHWTWLGEEVQVPGRDKPVRIGKKNLLNNFCIGTAPNLPACTNCHVGYGWKDDSFDFSRQENVDCLVCHDQSGTYLKKPKAAGLPDPSVDLLAVARSVGRPSRRNCGVCHFSGGGGNAVKHGDLDQSLLNPSARLDVHMGRFDFTCVDCHRAPGHKVAGRAISVSVDAKNRVRCTDCHQDKPHDDDRLNTHTARVACESCHIPAFGVDTPTKMSWDWSEAGKDIGDDVHTYMKIKGRFVYERGARPEYAWYNETSGRHLPGDKIDPSKPTKMAWPLGSRDDAKSKLWPFKVHRGRQPYDAEHKHFLVPSTAGPDGYWSKFDWPLALAAGAKFSGIPYSGKHDFAPTEMYWPQEHMVAPKENALQCRDCHGERGRLDWQGLGYEKDPVAASVLQHERVVLKDLTGTPVVRSRKPFSPKATCGECHDFADESFRRSHTAHARVKPDGVALERRALLTNGPAFLEGQETNCLLCHGAQVDRAARAAAGTESAWSIAATVPGLLVADGKGWKYSPAAFDGDGAADLRLSHAADRNCGACHAAVGDGSRPFALAPRAVPPRVLSTGEVFAPDRIHRSGLNLAGKDALARPFDVHAERLVGCGDCHSSRPRPAQRLGGNAREPADGAARRCENCHDTSRLHASMPSGSIHLAKVACTSCHVPSLPAAAQEQVDRTVVRADGSPLVTWRGVAEGDWGRDPASAFLRGYTPFLLSAGAEGLHKLSPWNIVTTWRWVDRAGAPVPEELVRRAFLGDGGHAAEILAAFDANKDRTLDDAELRLDEKRMGVVAARLAALGVAEPRIEGEMRPHAIRHGVVRGAVARRGCADCHPVGDADRKPFELAAYLPGGVRPAPARDAEAAIEGRFEVTPAGALVLVGTRPAAKATQRESGEKR